MLRYILIVAIISHLSFFQALDAKESQKITPELFKKSLEKDIVCGEPLYMARAKSLLPYSETPLDSNLKKIEKFFKEVSKSNLNQIKTLLYPLNKSEKKLVNKIKRFKLRLIHRTTLEQFKQVIKSEGLVSHSQQRTKNSNITAYTPPLEQELFGAYSCVFATAGPPEGRKQYGPIKIMIDRNFSDLMWATLSSGWYFMEGQGHEEKTKPNLNDRVQFSNQLVTANDFEEYFAYLVISHLRKDSQNYEKNIQSLLSLKKYEEFFEYIDKNKLGYLEVKIHGTVPVESFDKIELPKSEESKIAPLIPQKSRWSRIIQYE